MNNKGLYSQLVQSYIELLKAQTDTSFSKDDAVACVALLGSMCDIALETAERKRTCPGRYWRSHKASKDAIEAYNTNDRKRQKVDLEATCGNDGSQLAFDKGYVGPEREPDDEGKSRLLCNACGNAYSRDKKRGFVK